VYFQTVFSEDFTNKTHALRPLSNYSVRTLTQPHVYGVKHACLLNSLQYFNTTGNFSVDIIHYILEGVAQFQVKLVLQYIQANFVTAKDVYGRVNSFNYGYTERRNRPAAHKLDDGSNDLCLNAIQSWCLPGAEIPGGTGDTRPPHPGKNMICPPQYITET
jgi:hypothetical protein